MDRPADSGGCCVDLRDILKTLDTGADEPTTENRLDQYKKTKGIPSQEERRRQYLQSVKDRRHDFVAQARLIALGEDDEDEDENEEMDTTAHRGSYQRRRRPTARNYLKNQLMLSEWLVQLPEDFESDWLVVPCPVAKRCLVVASRGRTKAFTRLGHQICSFSSLLPGGNSRSDRSTYSILDCLYSRDQKLFYVLDIMCWQGHPVYDCDTTFRFYWLRTKMEEIPGLVSHSEMNQNRFVRLESHDCAPSMIQDLLSSPVPFQLDGLIFYHKSCPYRQGVCPLVGWLKAFMVPEILPSVSVPESLCTDRPSDYVSMQQYLVKAFKKHQRMHCDQ